jgi:ABC-type cobalamin/Fe3+-siderophores transport system ATPase subunit
MGPRTSGPPTIVDLRKPTIIVGPNRSGKSSLLRDLHRWALGGKGNYTLLQDVEWNKPNSVSEWLARVNEFLVEPGNRDRAADEHFFESPIFGGREGISGSMREENMQVWLRHNDDRHVRKYLTKFVSILLDGQTRLSLTEPTQENRLNGAPKNHLMRLFRQDDVRREIQDICMDEFRVVPVVDHTGLPELALKISSERPDLETHERSVMETAIRYFSTAEDIRTAGDGLRCFIGLIAAIACLRHELVLIDEPEAFLHPPLARRLGAELARRSEKDEMSLLIATHSSNFLMGFLSVNPAPNIVRLTYSGGRGTARMIQGVRIEELVKQPFLRSSGVLDGIFHRAVIVGEADSDRVLYDEINRRLRNEGRGIRDALFINGQGKQSLYKIVGPLRELGVPAIPVVDFDYVLCTGGEWRNLLDACNVDVATRTLATTLREKVKQAARNQFAPASWREEISQKGVSILNKSGQKAAREMVSQLSGFGLFVVPNGPLESWLVKYDIPGQKTEWLLNALERLGYNEKAKNYLKPGRGDVWGFVDRMSKWLREGTYKGMPE